MTAALARDLSGASQELRWEVEGEAEKGGCFELFRESDYSDAETNMFVLMEAERPRSAPDRGRSGFSEKSWPLRLRSQPERSFSPAQSGEKTALLSLRIVHSRDDFTLLERV